MYRCSKLGLRAYENFITCKDVDQISISTETLLQTSSGRFLAWKSQLWCGLGVVSPFSFPPCHLQIQRHWDCTPLSDYSKCGLTLIPPPHVLPRCEHRQSVIIFPASVCTLKHSYFSQTLSFRRVTRRLRILMPYASLEAGFGVTISREIHAHGQPHSEGRHHSDLPSFIYRFYELKKTRQHTLDMFKHCRETWSFPPLYVLIVSKNFHVLITGLPFHRSGPISQIHHKCEPKVPLCHRMLWLRSCSYGSRGSFRD